MKKRISLKLGMVFILSLVLILSACTGKNEVQEGNELNPPEVSDPDPVTLRVLNHVPAEYEDVFGQAIVEQFPHVTLEWTFFQQLSASERSLERLITSGYFPDLIITSSSNGIHHFQDVDLSYDLRELIKQNNFELNRIEPVAIQAISSYGDGEIYALPFYTNYGNLFYNKDLFEKFGVDYPKDDMTWEDAIQLAQRLARTEDGKDYKGMDYVGARFIAASLSLPRVDPVTHKSVLNTDGYRKVLQVVERFTSTGNQRSNNLDAFLRNQTVAMAIFRNAEIITGLNRLNETGDMFDWDVTTLPVFQDGPRYNMDFDAHVFMISPTSDHKETVFDLVQFLLSDEMQLKLTRTGLMTSLKDEAIKTQFAADLEMFQGKNIAGIIKYPPAPAIPPTEFRSIGDKYLRQAEEAVIRGQKDINTALREADEAANNEINTILSGRAN